MCFPFPRNVSVRDNRYILTLFGDFVNDKIVNLNAISLAGAQIATYHCRDDHWSPVSKAHRKTKPSHSAPTSYKVSRRRRRERGHQRKTLISENARVSVQGLPWSTQETRARGKTKKHAHQKMRVYVRGDSPLVGAGGFGPPKLKAADLQSVPFGHSGTLPYGAGERSRTINLLITNQLLCH